LRQYLDSSVLVKLYKQEKDSDRMDKIIQRVKMRTLTPFCAMIDILRE
jgi:predicted nucleic acid-binding protein